MALLATSLEIPRKCLSLRVSMTGFLTALNHQGTAPRPCSVPIPRPAVTVGSGWSLARSLNSSPASFPLSFQRLWNLPAAYFPACHIPIATTLAPIDGGASTQPMPDTKVPKTVAPIAAPTAPIAAYFAYLTSLLKKMLDTERDVENMQIHDWGWPLAIV